MRPLLIGCGGCVDVVSGDGGCGSVVIVVVVALLVVTVSVVFVDIVDALILIVKVAVLVAFVVVAPVSFCNQQTFHHVSIRPNSAQENSTCTQKSGARKSPELPQRIHPTAILNDTRLSHRVTDVA